MLQLILTILKIIGIILAALLGIVLVVLLAVLFIPIGYDARIDNKNDILIKANGWWLFHAFHVSFDMEGIPSEEKGNIPVIKFRILGIPIVDTSRKKEENAVKGAEPEKQKAEPVRSVTEKSDIPKQEPQLMVQEISLKEEKVKKKVPADKTSKAVEQKTPVKKEKEKKPKVSITSKIRNLVDGIKKKIQNIRDTKQKLQDKINALKAFIQNEENVKGMKRIFRSIKKILKCLLPKKIKGHVMFGMNDPCTTGQALGVLAMLYPYYGKSLVIEPDFTKQVLVADVYIKGYIQIVTLCIIGIKVLLDENFRKLIKNFKRLREG